MATTMKALRKMQAARACRWIRSRCRRPGPTDVLVRVKTASISERTCTFTDGTAGRRGASSRLDAGARILRGRRSAWEEVRAVKPGDFVSAEMHVNCGHCHRCREAHSLQICAFIGIGWQCPQLTCISALTIARLDGAAPLPPRARRPRKIRASVKGGLMRPSTSGPIA